MRKLVIALVAVGGLYGLYRWYMNRGAIAGKSKPAVPPDPLTGGGNQTEVVFTDEEAGLV